MYEESLKKYFESNKSASINIEKHREIMAKCKGKIVNQYTLENEFIRQYKSICSSIKIFKFLYMRFN